MNPIVPHLSRRTLLRSSTCGFGYLAFAGLSTWAAEKDDPLDPRTESFPARAKRVIFLCMEGAPSHVDTFDYKPKLAERDGKSMPNARTFGKTAGLAHSNLPSTAKAIFGSPSYSRNWPPRPTNCACCAACTPTCRPIRRRSCKCIRESRSSRRPSMGAWTFYGLGTENENLPGFVTISPPLQNGGPANYGSAFLPAIYQGTPIGGFRSFGGFGGRGGSGSVSNIKNPKQAIEAQRAQLDFIQSLNQEELEREPHNAGVEGAIESSRTGLPHAEGSSQSDGSQQRIGGDQIALRHRRPGNGEFRPAMSAGPAACRGRRSIRRDHFGPVGPSLQFEELPSRTRPRASTSRSPAC